MPKTILLADDSVTIQKVVAISFASEDATVVTVDNGDDAISKTREIRPDIVLADVVMPGKNGYEVCEAIKADPELANIPVLLLTGTFEAFDEARARSVGSAGHIAKPFEAQSLVNEVHNLIEAAAAAAPPISAPAAEAAPDPAVDAGAFDFFDDEMSAPDTAPAQNAPDQASDFGFQDSADNFSFGDDDLIPPASAPEQSAPIAPDPAPQAEPIAAGAANAFGGATPIGEELEVPPVASAQLAADSDSLDDSLAPDASRSGDQPFDFALADDPTNPTDPLGDLDLVPPVDANDLAQATVIDPLGASGYDVSSSDLGTPVAEAETPRAAEAEMTVVAPEGLPEVNPGADIDPFESTPAASDLTTVAGQDPVYEGFAESPQVEPVPVAVVDEAPAEIAEDLYTPPAPAAATMEASVEPAAQSVAQPAAQPAEAMMASIGPELRQQLHDTLEKIAWESFGDLTEAIVRQSVERVEAIAWEVIPRMAETLIQEEIRRMKSEPEEN
ncbi:MAG: response regulator [Deltaproteobacteria bacterium]|jgi:CheY-like chemotaxis protein|nr:response regulator [Deltaproteobacteria bacterium]